MNLVRIPTKSGPNWSGRTLEQISVIPQLVYYTTLTCKIKVSNSISIQKFQSNPKQLAIPKRANFGLFSGFFQAVLNRFRIVLDHFCAIFCVFLSLLSSRRCFQRHCRAIDPKFNFQEVFQKKICSLIILRVGVVLGCMGSE